MFLNQIKLLKSPVKYQKYYPIYDIKTSYLAYYLADLILMRQELQGRHAELFWEII